MRCKLYFLKAIRSPEIFIITNYYYFYIFSWK